VITGRRPVRPLLARLSGSSLRSKLALLSALLTALVVGAAFIALRIRTEADVRHAFVAELDASQAAVRHLQDRNLHLLLAAAAVASTSPTLRAALQTWRTDAKDSLALATIQREAERIFQDLDRELLVVTDEGGQVVASIGPPGTPSRGESMLRLPAVRAALLSDPTTSDSAFGVLRGRGAALSVGAVAILVDGFPIGALLLGERVDSILPRPRAPGDTRGVVTAGGVVVASSLDQAPTGSRWEALSSNQADSTSVLRLGGEDYITASLPLGRGEDGRPVVLYLMRSLTASVGPISSSLARRFVFAGVVAVVLVGAGGALVSRSALRPLSRFVAFLRAGAASGSPALFEEPQSPTEVATLTDAYNRLIASLNRERDQLERSTADLATTNETLRLQVEERERAERALRDSEDQLRQSQKLEALGALAGGVAHDFNNLLSVILGYSQFTIEALPADSQQRADVQQISEAGKRASGLVKQLLAFSRKQVLQPQIVDLNRIVTGMQPLLRPLLGEDVIVESRLAPSLRRIRADPGQIEQVILNLAVNARDAMPNGGTLAIETANVVLDERSEGLPLPGGPAVMLAIRDTGTGMDAVTRQRIFEPFFTTKPLGQGTGLGLSTVYGIVRQSEGNITVFSEPGQGSVFRCYFPSASEASLEPGGELRSPDACAGSETILIAEDEGEVRALMRRALLRQGYTVLEASHGREALELAGGYPETIDLLITDAVMPFVSGRELAERLTATRPGLRVLIVSGYSGEAVERHGVLTPESVFLQKPILPATLLAAVRDILDLAAAPPGGMT
jgi:signal transduction histidine kinase/ActR/RegA family two-component response regulator